MKAFRVKTCGGISSLKLRKNIDIGDVGDYEIMIKHTALGLSFFDVEAIRGDQGIKAPFIPGAEVVGIVEKIGRGVANFQVGDRVACCVAGYGGFAQKSITHMKNCVRIPLFINDETAAAGYAKSMVAVTLLARVFFANEGAKVVILNAAGGVGHILTQLAKHAKCLVIGVVGTSEKAVLASKHGCDVVYTMGDEDLAGKIIDYSGGYGVNAVFDSICNSDTVKLAEKVSDIFGMYVPYGKISDTNPKINTMRTERKSLYVTRPNMLHYYGTTLNLQITSAQVFELIKLGIIRPRINKKYKFTDLPKALRLLSEGRLALSNIVVF